MTFRRAGGDQGDRVTFQEVVLGHPHGRRVPGYRPGVTPPAAAVTEHASFGSLTIAFDHRVLRPRTWTTMQSVWAASLLDTVADGPVLELCAGAGHIGLLAVADSDRRLVCVDANPIACDFARANAESAGLADRVQVREGRLEDVVLDGETFPLVVADPPWVPRDETSRFPEDPLLAIDGGDDGLVVARACLRVIAGHLSPGGVALLQLGTTAQAHALEDLMATAGLVLTEMREHERGVLARLDPATS